MNTDAEPMLAVASEAGVDNVFEQRQVFQRPHRTAMDDRHARLVLHAMV
jgi:hypothetical protein